MVRLTPALALGGLLLVCACRPLPAQTGAVRRVHDPVIARSAGAYWVFSTGVGRGNTVFVRRSEDLYTGTYWRGSLGYASKEFGSDRDAWVLATSAGMSVERGENNAHTGVFAVSAQGRLEDGDLRNGVLTALARYYWRTSPRQLFFASLSATVTEDLDPDRQLLLGRGRFDFVHLR